MLFEPWYIEDLCIKTFDIRTFEHDATYPVAIKRYQRTFYYPMLFWKAYYSAKHHHFQHRPIRNRVFLPTTIRLIRGRA